MSSNNNNNKSSINWSLLLGASIAGAAIGSAVTWLFTRKNVSNKEDEETKSSVLQRYNKASKAVEPKLCCPINYNPEFLKAIPKDVIERDYGCGDPSAFVSAGDVVLDLGSGTGKICFIAAQIVGKTGKVIGVDFSDDMLKIARDASPVVAENIGYNNVEFIKGEIHDLSAIESNSIDVVVSNCVLNLVVDTLKVKMFKEIFRVLKPSGKAAISDIVASSQVPEHLKLDQDLWSGCISGALEKNDFINAFYNVGFETVELAKLQNEAWQIVENIEFRSATVVAYKSKTEVKTKNTESTQKCCC